MKRDYFDELVRQYKENKLNEGETEILESWLHSIDLSSDQEQWTISEREALKKELQQRLHIKRKPYPLWKKMVGAASVVLALSIAGYSWYYFQKINQHAEDQELVVAPIVPAISKGVLYHEGGEKVQLNTLAQDSVYQFEKISVERITENEIRIIPREGSEDELQFIEAPKGGNFIVRLADGSKLTLNANSSIVFPASFSAYQRKVETRGEVFFEVEKDKLGRPFVVKAGDTQIKVLGTKFNVNYKEGQYLRTALFEGKVVVRNPGFEVQLQPGNELNLDATGKYTVTKFATEQVGAWKEGYFSLEHKNIAQIMEEVGDWYNVEIVYADVDLDVRYHGSVSKFSDIETLLDILSLAKGNTFEIKGRRIMVR